ncbi:MAG: hypothetical protein ABIG96_03495, partial [Candidatus Micrarchaeota archaeon]
MVEWRNLIPPSEEVVLATNGNFYEFDGEKEKQQLGLIVLTKSRIYLIHLKGLVMSVAKMHVAIPLESLTALKVTGNLIRFLEFDYSINSVNKHVMFVSFDFEVRKLLEEIEYASDNP